MLKCKSGIAKAMPTFQKRLRSHGACCSLVLPITLPVSMDTSSSRSLGEGGGERRYALSRDNLSNIWRCSSFESESVQKIVSRTTKFRYPFLSRYFNFVKWSKFQHLLNQLLLKEVTTNILSRNQKTKNSMQASQRCT